MPFIASAGWLVLGLAESASMALSSAGGIAALSGAGLGLSIYGTYQQGKAAEEEAEYNAELMRREAEAEEQATSVEEQRLIERGEKIKAAQRARYGQAGVGFEGTPELVIADTAAEIEKDRQLLRLGGARRASAMRSQATLDVARGKEAKASSRRSMFGQLMTGSAGTLYRYGVQKGWKGYRNA